MSDMELLAYSESLTREILAFFSFLSDEVSVLDALRSPMGVYLCPMDLHFVVTTLSASYLNLIPLDIDCWNRVRKSLKYFTWDGADLDAFALRFNNIAQLLCHPTGHLQQPG